MNQDGPSLIIEAPPPPPQPPEYRNRLMFLQMKKYFNIYYLLFFLVVPLSPLLLGLHDTSTSYGSPRTPKNNKKFILFIRLLLYFKCCWRIALSCVRNIFQNVHGALKYIYIKCLLVLLTMYADLGRPGDTFAVAGDRAI